jgi:hypothetical protein
MAGYVRKTIMSPSEILEQANEALPGRLGLTAVKAGDHDATFAGKEGRVTIGAHRHSSYTEVVAETDQLRTSRMDYEIQRFLNRLPYEAGDVGGPGSGEFVPPRG